MKILNPINITQMLIFFVLFTLDNFFFYHKTVSFFSLFYFNPQRDVIEKNRKEKREGKKQSTPAMNNNEIESNCVSKKLIFLPLL